MTPAPDDTYSPAAFFARTLDARLQELQRLWAALEQGGFRDGMILVLDFTLFGPDADAAAAIAARLEGTYQTEVRALEPGGWMLVGTTRPYGSRFTQAKLRDWVRFVADLAAAHGFVFSLWSVEVPATGAVLASEQFEAPPAA